MEDVLEDQGTKTMLDEDSGKMVGQVTPLCCRRHRLTKEADGAQKTQNLMK